MKFSKGHWLNKNGVQIYSAMQVRQTRVLENRLYLYTVPYQQNVPSVGGAMMEM